MARGISETDVWQAADALLLEGQRPTIERVRGKIGRGSPNTVAPHLETWFRHLGGRIQDPGAFSAPPTLPDPIQQAAEHFWAVALSLARETCATQVAAAQTEADARVAAADDLRRQAEHQAERLNERMHALAADLDLRSRALEVERLAHAATRTRLETSTDQLAQATLRIEQLQAAATTERDHARRDIAAADERTQAAERRAALEIDRERQARARADKRAEQLEARLDTQLQQAQTELLKATDQSARQSAELQTLRVQAESLREAHATLQQQLRAARQDAAGHLDLSRQTQAEMTALQRELAVLRHAQVSTRPIRKTLRGSAFRPGRPVASSPDGDNA